MKHYKPQNVGAPVIELRHADLTRVGDSAYKSDCPVCKAGVLLVLRNQETFELQAEDHCFGCGQKFIYTDIEVMRARERGVHTGYGETCTREQKDKALEEAEKGYCQCGRPRARGHHLCTTCARRERRSRR